MQSLNRAAAMEASLQGKIFVRGNVCFSLRLATLLACFLVDPKNS
jgi:hypothetical protein